MTAPYLKSGSSIAQALVAGEKLVHRTKLFNVDAPAAKSATSVHAAFAGNDAALAFPGAFTSPAIPRNLRVTMATSWDGGAVVVVGTNQFGDAVSESFATGSNVVRVGSKIFATVTSATKGAVGAAAAAASIGTGDTLGLDEPIANAYGVGCASGVAEATTFDATNHSATPTTVPNAAINFLFIANT